MTLEALNSLTREEFVNTLGGIFEDSPWVADRAFGRRFSSLEDLHDTLKSHVEHAGVDQKLALLRAHPDLGTRAKVSPASAGEQAGAGLDRLTQEEYDRLARLNNAYRAKFGFPFLYAVKGSGKSAILEALESRSGNAPEVEFEEALNQVYRIARFRLEDLIR